LVLQAVRKKLGWFQMLRLHSDLVLLDSRQVVDFCLGRFGVALVLPHFQPVRGERGQSRPKKTIRCCSTSNEFSESNEFQ